MTPTLTQATQAESSVSRLQDTVILISVMQLSIYGVMD